MTDKNRHVMAITSFWMAVLSGAASLVAAAGVAYAFGLSSDVAVLKDQMAKMQQANVPERLAGIEQKVNNIDGNVADMKQNQEKLLQRFEYIGMRNNTHD